MTGEALTDRIKIPAVRRGLIDVHAGRDSVPTRKAIKPIDTPAEMTGNRTVGLIQSPLQEGIMAAQDDVGQSACIGCGVGTCAARCQPGLDGGPGEEQFSRGLGTGNLLPGDEVVNLLLLDAQ